jgi:hypothetical protein
MKTEMCQCGDLKTAGSRKCMGCYSKRLSDGESAFHAVWNDYVQQSRRRKLEWSITKSGARKLFETSCFYCGTPPTAIKTIPNGQGSFTFNGIDRVDNAIGYTQDNSVACCRICNFMKQGMSVGDFLAHIRKIVEATQCLKNI